MEYIVGGIFIVIGLLMGWFPRYLWGYKRMSKEDHVKFIASGFPKYIRAIFITMGVLILAGTYILNIMGYASQIGVMMIFIILGGVILYWIVQYKYAGNFIQYRQSRLSLILVILVITVGTGFGIYAIRPARISVNNERVDIKDIFGISIPFKDITEVALSDSLPATVHQMWGISIRNHRKGFFELEELGHATLFVYPHITPYIIIYSENNLPLIINGKSTEKTMELYRGLQKK